MGRLISLRLGLFADIKTIVVPSPTTFPTGGGVNESKTTRSRPGPVTDLLIFPTTQPEYTAVMDEITRLYQNGHYSQCSARCIQILDNIRDPVCTVPVPNKFSKTNKL